MSINITQEQLDRLIALGTDLTGCNFCIVNCGNSWCPYSRVNEHSKEKK